MNKRRLIFASVSVLICIAIVSLKIWNKEELTDPVIFHYLGTENKLSGLPMASCLISNQCQETIKVWDGLFVRQKVYGDLIIGQPWGVDTLPTSRTNFYMTPGSSREILFQLPTALTLHHKAFGVATLSTNEIRLGIQWSSGFKSNFADMLDTLPGFNNRKIEKRSAVSETIFLSQGGVSGEN